MGLHSRWIPAEVFPRIWHQGSVAIWQRAGCGDLDFGELFDDEPDEELAEEDGDEENALYRQPKPRPPTAGYV